MHRCYSAVWLGVIDFTSSSKSGKEESNFYNNSTVSCGKDRPCTIIFTSFYVCVICYYLFVVSAILSLLSSFLSSFVLFTSSWSVILSTSCATFLLNKLHTGWERMYNGEYFSKPSYELSAGYGMVKCHSYLSYISLFSLFSLSSLLWFYVVLLSKFLIQFM